MNKHIFWEDVVTDLYQEFKYTCHVETNRYDDVVVVEDVLGDNGVVRCRMGLPVDQDYARSSLIGFDSLHFDIYAKSNQLLDQCIALLTDIIDQQEQSPTNSQAA